MSFTASELKQISKDWAQERTLSELRDKMSSNNSILAAIAKAKDIDVQSIKEFNDALDEAKDGLSQMQIEAEKAKRAQVNNLRYEQRMKDYDKEIQGSYKRSVDDLRSSLDRMSKFDSTRLYDGVTSGLALLEQKTRDTSGNATKLSSAFSLLNKSVAAVAATVGIFAAGMPAFQSMLNTGVTFGGSLEKMQEMVGRTGLKLDEFQGIVGQFGTTIGGIGEENFVKLVRGVQDATRQFGGLGETGRQQAENVAFFVDLLTSGGAAYKMSGAMQLEGAVKYTRELTALTELTGKEKKEIQARQRAAAEDTAIALRIRQLRRTDPAAAARMEENRNRLSGALGKDLARAVIGMQMGIMPRDEQMRAFMSIGGMMPAMEQLSRGVTTAGPEEMAAAIRNFQTTAQESPGLDAFGLQAFAGGSFAGAADIYQGVLKDADRAEAAQQRVGGLERILNIMTGRGGNLDRATTAMQKVTMDTARITGDFKAALYAATQQLGLFTAVLEPLAAASGVGAGAANSFYGMAASGISGAASALATGAAVALMPKLLASTALRAAIPRFLGGGGLGLTSMLGSTGMMSGLMRGTSNFLAGAQGVSKLRMGGAGLAGAVGGLGGSYGASALGMSPLLGAILGGAGTGALAGAVFGGGIPGAIVGGLIGGISGGLTGGIGGAQAAETGQGDGVQNPVDDSVRLLQAQANSNTYVAAAVELARNMSAQLNFMPNVPSSAPAEMTQILQSLQEIHAAIAGQTPILQDQYRVSRRSYEERE